MTRAVRKSYGYYKDQEDEKSLARLIGAIDSVCTNFISLRAFAWDFL